MTVGVLFGGNSTEYEVSCSSAANILDNLTFCEVRKIGITRDGRWFLTEATPEEIRSLRWNTRPDNRPLSADLSEKCFATEGKKLALDAVFPVLHGKNGEDGTVQGLLECLGIPYVGCNTLSSALCMDKATANRIFREAGIEHTPWFSFTAEEWRADSPSILSRMKELSFPVFIKPSAAGSSVGITRCLTPEEIPAAVKEALSVDSTVLAEQGVSDAMELEVAVLGQGMTAKAFGPGRILSAECFYSYSSKYENPASATQIPAYIPSETAKKIRSEALRAYRACGCRGLSRVDFFMTGDGKILLNEINTLPGFTSISMYPQLMTAGGMSYAQLLEALLETALLP